MKKNILTLLGCTIISFGSIAKINTPINYTCYEVDGVTTYDVTGCVPGSSIVFYSKPWGGDILKEVTTDATGHANVVWGEQKPPAFVLNKPTANGNKVSGNGMVATTPGKDFVLYDLSLSNNDGSTTLSWAATFSNPERYIFEVLKTTSDAGYTVIKTIPAKFGDQASYLLSDCEPENGSGSYKVQIRATSGGILYASSLMHGSGNKIMVYPTIARNVVHVKLSGNELGMYRVLDVQGKVLSTGTLSADQNSVDVSKLTAGNYVIQITSSDRKLTAKFVKE